MATDRQTVDVDGREVTLSHLDKVVYPGGTTKAEVIDYYARIAPAIVAQLKGRPVTLRRFPDGAAEPGFWQKRCPEQRPDWVKTTAVTTSSGKEIGFCQIRDRAALIWAVNQGTIEFHPSLHSIGSENHPDWMVFDLDPGDGRDIVDCGELALQIRSRLADTGLDSVVKTTGSQGLHLYVPLGRKVTYEASAGYARQLAASFEKEDPDRVTTNMKREVRRGRIFVDWSQNNPAKTTVAAYSLRAGEEPQVATPVRWDEVGLAVEQCRPDVLRFTPGQAIQRFEEMRDLMTSSADRQRREGSMAAVS